MVFAALVLADMTASDTRAQALGVDLFDAPDDLKQARSTRDTVGFQRRRYGEADRLFGAGGIGDDQIGGEGVKMTFDALDAGVEALQVDGDIGALHLISPF